MKRAILTVVVMVVSADAVLLAEFRRNFPQFVAGGGSSTSFRIHNPGQSTTVVDLEIFAGNGQRINGVECGGRSFTLGPGETQQIVCTLDGDLTTGWAMVTSVADFVATAFLDVASHSRVGVLPSATAARVAVFAVSGEARTGIAVDNPSASTSTTLTLRFRNMAGAVRPCDGNETKTVGLEPLHHQARFADELCGGFEDFEGVVEVTASPVPVAILSLVQDTATDTITTVATSPVLLPEIHSEHFFHGYPAGTPPTNDLLMRDIYALSSNDDTKFADWVAYRLTEETITGDPLPDAPFKKDPWLDEGETLEPSDYDDAFEALGTDRGHLAPLASFEGEKSWEDLNFLSNITPQRTALNRGTWKSLEFKVRDLVESGETVYVMTGPLYERNMPSLPQADETHRVPSGYWKIVVVGETTDSGTIRAASFIFDQDPPYPALIETLSTINGVERRSGLDFLWQLDDEAEEQIESGPFEEWARGWVE